MLSSSAEIWIPFYGKWFNVQIRFVLFGNSRYQKSLPNRHHIYLQRIHGPSLFHAQWIDALYIRMTTLSYELIKGGIAQRPSTYHIPFATRKQCHIIDEYR